MALALDSSGSNPWLRNHARGAIHSKPTQRGEHLSPSTKKANNSHH